MSSDEMVYYGTTSRIRGFDPVKAGDVASSIAASKVYEGLFQYAYLDRPYHVEPLLAESLPSVSEDGLTYTFTVRKGIYFQDDPCFVETDGKGRELVAEDFVYAIKRISDLKNESTGYWVFNDRIVGLDEFREASGSEDPTDYTVAIEGLSALDRYTLQLKLKRPYPQLLWILTMHYAFAVPREAVEYYGDEFLNHPVGTGPYILKTWRRNYRIEFVRNPKWVETGRVELYPGSTDPADGDAGLLADIGHPLPFIDRIVQRVVDDPSTQWLMFLQGEIESSGISRDNWDVVITDGNNLTGELKERGIRLLKAVTLDLYYIGFNMDDPIVGASDDPDADARHKKLRQALTCAFNTAEWIRFHNDRITRPTGPVPPGVAGYADKDPMFPFDLARARQLLRDAGYPDGQDPATGRRLILTLELGSAQSPEFRQSTELFASFMNELGVVIEASYNNWPTFLGKMDRRQAQMYRLGWVADYPDAENFLQLFYGPNSSPGPNHSNYVNPDFDALYEKARIMQDGPERTELYARMADIVIDDCPWIFTATPLSYGLHHAWIRNYKHHDFPYGMIKYYRIDMDRRKKEDTQ
ncbi:MAG: hypothetical protein KJ626_01465 [Verrucomicrobia bacterium]|nr:hypothetical protein [Verrucomicrobiota bacterium]